MCEFVASSTSKEVEMIKIYIYSLGFLFLFRTSSVVALALVNVVCTMASFVRLSQHSNESNRSTHLSVCAVPVGTRISGTSIRAGTVRYCTARMYTTVCNASLTNATVPAMPNAKQKTTNNDNKVYEASSKDD
jgi:hypothetical protein